MSHIGCFGKQSPVSGSRDQRLVALHKRAGTKIALPKWMSQFAAKIGLVDRKIAPPKHSLCTALLRKSVDPREMMVELVKLSRNTDGAIEDRIKNTLQNLSSSELKKVHRAIGNNTATILAAIKELHEVLGQDRTKNDAEFLKYVSSIHMNLVTLFLEVESKLIEQEIKIKKIDPKVNDVQRKWIVDLLKSAWRDLSNNPLLSSMELIEARLYQPTRPVASAPLTRPHLPGRLNPPATADSVLSEFNREGTIQPGFKDMLKQALAAAGMDSDGEPTQLAEDVVSHLNNVRAEVRRELLGELLQAIDGRGAEQDETLVGIVKQIGARAREAEAQMPAFGLEGAFTVEAATDRVHDLALMVLGDFDDKQLAWATGEELSSRSNPARARRFLGIAEHADLAGRSSVVLRGIRDFATAAPAREEAVAPEPPDPDADFPPLAHSVNRPGLEGRPPLPATGPAISGQRYAIMICGLVRDDFTRNGIIIPNRLEVLFNEAAAHSGYTYSRELVRATIDRLNALPTAVCDPLLNDLLHALGEEAKGGASERLVAKVLAKIEETADQPLQTWKHLSQAQDPEEASFIIHDIARQAPGSRSSEDFRIWGSEWLRQAEGSGEISRAAASRFLALADPLPLQGRSAAVREVIQAYASGDDVPSWHRGLVRDYFLCFGTIPAEAFELLFEDAKQSGHTYHEGLVQRARDQLCALPAESCAGWLNELLNALGGKAEQRVNAVLLKINKDAARTDQSFKSWKDLSRAGTPEQSCFVIHDIAREGEEPQSDTEFRTSGLALLGEANISKAVADEFLELSAAFPMEGRSATVREIIREYAGSAVT